MSPVSIDKSFNRTLWTTLSALRKTTICPPASAGFGENDNAPFCRLMVMVKFDGVGDGDGEVGVLLPPPHVETQTATTITPRDAMRLRGMETPCSPQLSVQARARSIPVDTCHDAA
jgi:hypothetical protein